MTKAYVEFNIKYTCEIPVQGHLTEDVMDSLVAHLPTSFWNAPGFGDGDITITHYECWEEIKGYGSENL